MQLTALTVATVLGNVGFPPPLVPIMTCIAQHESSFRPLIVNYNTNGTIDYGVMQVNTVWLENCHATTESIFNIYVNTKCALMVYDKQGITAWVTFNKFSNQCLAYKIVGYHLPASEKLYTVIEKSEIL